MEKNVICFLLKNINNFHIRMWIYNSLTILGWMHIEKSKKLYNHIHFSIFIHYCTLLPQTVLKYTLTSLCTNQPIKKKQQNNKLIISFCGELKINLQFFWERAPCVQECNCKSCKTSIPNLQVEQLELNGRM